MADEETIKDTQPEEPEATTPTEPEDKEVEEEKPTEPTEPTQETEPPKEEEEIKDVLSQNGFDYKALEEEYIANGGLTEETTAKLNKLGFTNEFIQDFVKGKEAIFEQEKNELAEVIGGRAVYDEVINWAAKNFTPDEIQSINAIRDKNIIRMLLPTLKARMEAAEGKDPQTIMQGSNKPLAGDIFESKEQMYEAIRNEKYLKDPAYAAKVTAKIRASREAGIDLGI